MPHDTGDAEDVAGEDPPAQAMVVACSDELICRARRLTLEAAEECTRLMFMLCAGGPHPSQLPPIANYPTFEEITTAKAAIIKVIGEKGSDKRKQANEISKRGLLDQEEALGWVVCDRFNAVYPSDEKAARDVAKRANDKAPNKKVKEGWKRAARQAREAAQATGAAEDKVAAAGVAATAVAKLHFGQREADLKVGSRGEQLLQSLPIPLPPLPSPPPLKSEPAHEEPCRHGVALVEMANSLVASCAIIWAYRCIGRARLALDPYFNSKVEVAQVHSPSMHAHANLVSHRFSSHLPLPLLQIEYKHALRQLKRAYHFKFNGWPEDRPELMVHWTIQFEAAGHSIPVAVRAARENGVDLRKAAEMHGVKKGAV